MEPGNDEEAAEENEESTQTELDLDKGILEVDETAINRVEDD